MKLFCKFLLCALACLAIVPAAYAQGFEPPALSEPAYGSPAAEKARRLFERYRTPGTRPATPIAALTVTGTYSDNVFADNTGTQDDFITTITPSLGFIRDFGRGSVEIGGTADIVRYADFSDENHENYILAAGGSYDITGLWGVRGNLSYGRLSEDRTSLNALQNTVGRTEFDEFNGSLSLRYAPGPLSWEMGGHIQDLDFENVRTRSGTILNNDQRDRTEAGATLGALYGLRRDLHAGLRIGYDDISYDQRFDNNGFERSGERMRGGVVIEGRVTPSLKLNLEAGYTRRGYDDSRLETAGAPYYEADMIWQFSSLSSLSLSAQRDIAEVFDPAASGADASSYQVRLDHELRPDWFLGLGGSYGRQDFKDTGREDDLYAAFIQTRYRFTSYLGLTGGYGHEQRDSSLNSRDYKINRIYLSLGASY